MVTSIARQSVIIKCNMQKSVMLGNYEFYYGAGLLSRLYGIEIPDDIQPVALQELLAEQLEKVSTGDEKEAYLVKIAKEYVAGEDYDEQMKELLLWGKQEVYLWQVNIPAKN